MSDEFSNGSGTTAPAISVKGLVKRYAKSKSNAVDGVSF